MKISSQTSDFEGLKASTVVRFCHKTDFATDPFLKKLNKTLTGAIERIYKTGEFEGKLNQSVVLHTGSYLAADRVVLAGVGEKKKVNRDCYRQVAGTISRLSAVKSSDSIAFFIDKGVSARLTSAIIEGFMLGGHEISEYKGKGNILGNNNKTLVFCGKTKEDAAILNRGIIPGQIVAEGVILARRLAADPGNILNPQRFSLKAKSLSKEYGLECDILDEAKIKSEKMGALLAVGNGSDSPPRLVVLKYNGGRKGGRPIVLVGKGITFDSGGLCIKEPLDMIEMKSDKSGGAIVLASIITAARLGLRQNITAIIPLAENMPSGSAVRPGDIVTTRKGITVEVINTDAEGRLILADALDYADKFAPQAVIDIATLTGAAKYILGHAGIPILGNNKKLLNQVKSASDECDERVWELPIWDEHRNMMKSSIADLKNSAGKPAGTIAASAFLESFIGDWPWAHIDIAAMDFENFGRPYIPVGTTANGLRLLVELLASWKKV